MKKKSVLLYLMLIVLIIVSGCTQKKESPQTNSNDSGWDYASGIQPYLGDWHERIVMQEKGFYFGNPSDGMLYYYDYVAKKSIPVCSKPDCNHKSPLSNTVGSSSTTDDQKKEVYDDKTSSCDAYLGQSYGNMTIYKGRLYYHSSDSTDVLDKNSICSVSLDGSDHQMELEDYMVVNYNTIPTFHYLTGGKLFFSTNSDIHKSVVSFIDLGTKKTTILYTHDADEDYADTPTVYRDKVYYIRWTDDNYQGTFYQYSLKTKKTKTIYTGIIAGYTFVKDQIYFSNGESICKMSLNGENPTPVFEVAGRQALRYDGKYLYLDDAELAGLGKTDSKPIQVTKLNGTLVDSIERVGVPVYGDQNVFFLAYRYKNDLTSHLGFMKKTDIGKKHSFCDLVTGKEIDEGKLFN